MKLPNSIAYHRKRKGLTQSQLSVILGMSRPMLSGYEEGHNIPTFELIERIAQELDATVAQIYPNLVLDFLIQVDKAKVG